MKYHITELYSFLTLKCCKNAKTHIILTTVFQTIKTLIHHNLFRIFENIAGQMLKAAKHFQDHILKNNNTQKKYENSSSNENDIPIPPQRIHRAKRCRMC